MSRDESTKQYKKMPTSPVSTDFNFDKTEKIISDLTAYCPTFGPLSPTITNDNQLDVEAVLDSLQDPAADGYVVPNQLTENMNKKMDTLNSTVETLQSEVTDLRSVIRQHSEKIATLTKPQSSPIPPRSNHNFQTYPYNRYNRYNTPFHTNKRYRSRSPINSSTMKHRNRTPVSSPRTTPIRTPRKKTLARRQ
jgi:hypothetical protein